MTGHERGFSCAVTGKWASRPEFCGPHTKTLKAQLSPDGVARAAPDQGQESIDHERTLGMPDA